MRAAAPNRSTRGRLGRRCLPRQGGDDPHCQSRRRTMRRQVRCARPRASPGSPPVPPGRTDTRAIWRRGKTGGSGRSADPRRRPARLRAIVVHGTLLVGDPRLAQASLARDRRDMTVPGGTPVTAAMSLYDRSSISRRISISRYSAGSWPRGCRRFRYRPGPAASLRGLGFGSVQSRSAGAGWNNCRPERLSFSQSRKLLRTMVNSQTRKLSPPERIEVAESSQIGILHHVLRIGWCCRSASAPGGTRHPRCGIASSSKRRFGSSAATSCTLCEVIIIPSKRPIYSHPKNSFRMGNIDRRGRVTLSDRGPQVRPLDGAKQWTPSSMIPSRRRPIGVDF